MSGEALQGMLRKLLADIDVADAGQRFAVYDTARRRVDAFIASRQPPLPAEQAERIRASLESAIFEHEVQFPPLTPRRARFRLPMPGPRVRAGIRRVVYTGAGLTVLGLFLWAYLPPIEPPAPPRELTEVKGCMVAEEASPSLTARVNRRGIEFITFDEDPNLEYTVPEAPSPCVAAIVSTPNEELFAVYLPDENAAEDYYAADRIIAEPLASGRSVVSIKLPPYVAGRKVRIDPVGGKTGTLHSLKFGSLKQAGP